MLWTIVAGGIQGEPVEADVRAVTIGRELAEEHPAAQFLMDVTSQRLPCQLIHNTGLLAYLFQFMGKS